MSKEKVNVYEVITNRIIEALEKGVVPWRQPWRSGAPKNLLSGNAYSGVNAFILAAASAVGSGCKSEYWLTANQAKEKGGHVRKGERGTPIVFWKRFQNKDDKEARGGFMLRYYNVFNLDQTENVKLPKRVLELEPSEKEEIVSAEQIVARYPNRPTIEHGGNKACYTPSLDRVFVPERNSFKTSEHYYNILFHELIHSTGHESRLDRDGIRSISFGSHEYSVEELIAECGASFLCARAGIQHDLDNSAAYIGSWIGNLQKNPKWIIEAGSKAGKAVDYIMGESK